MRRRDLIVSVAAVTPLLAVRPAWTQQQRRVARIGILSSFGASDRERYEPMIEALRERGYVEGRSISFEFRFADGNSALVARHAADLVRIPVDLIVAIATPAGHAAKAATQTIPIVFTVADPLATGLVTNLARPGGNLSGVSTVAVDLAGKQIEMLREIVPGANRIAFLGSSQDPNTRTFQQQFEAAAAQLGIALDPLLVADPAGFEGAFAAAVAGGSAAMIVQPIFVSQRTRIGELAARYRLPWMGDNREFATAGALFAYGADRVWLWRRTGIQVARVLEGTPPGEMPVEQPTRFNLVVNLGAARALGLNVPPGVLLRADEVIE